ncbi:RHS repeat-associated core domain-containing protein [Microbulbifer sp. SH-1]|uniref:RHS repeat-associated core domain-containing protein n=1 Tax=Microbulbifer sp. SH-1 TaxID=2681547 RepID=UPI001409305C|nr:RHS repeat-associated core domain-containing protein [Microbulbifer sp. SH-1]
MSAIKSVAVTLKPSSPGAVSLSNVESGTVDTSGAFKVSWGVAGSSPKRDGYQIQQQFRAEGGSWSGWYPSSPSRTGNEYIWAQQLHEQSTLPDGDYQHRIRTYVNVGSYSNVSDWKYSSAITVRNKPEPVTGLHSTVAAPSSTFYMKWDEASYTGSGDYEDIVYQLQCKEPDDTDYGFDTCGSSSLSSTSKPIDLSEGSKGTYLFRVRACNGPIPAGCPDWSGAQTVSVPVDIPIPVPLTPQWDIEPLDRNYGQVAMSWKQPEGSWPVKDYILQQWCLAGKDNCGVDGWGDITPDEEGPESGSYSAQVELNDQYQYRVAACNEVGKCSAWLKTADWVKIHNPEGIVDVLETISTTVPGSMPYSTDVTATGDAVIRIPVTAAPGVNGLAPNISLNYSGLRYHERNREQLPEDILGYGWRLGGFSEIRRCITGQDLSATHITLDTNDSLCLNGEPLVLVNGTHWQKGAMYRTWRDSARLIELKETTEGKPWFQVKTADGRNLEFGGTPESRLRVGKSPYFAWSISKVTDAFGNAMEYHYHRDLAEGINYPLEIVYGNDGDARIQFEYGLRTDIPPQQLSETIDQGQLVLLYRILVKINEGSLREYRLISEDEGQIENYRRLKEVQLCGLTESGAVDQCLEPLKFKWKEHEPGKFEYNMDFPTGVEILTDSLGATTEFLYRGLSVGETEGFIVNSPFGSESGISVPDAYSLSPSYPDIEQPERGIYRLVVSKVIRSNGLTNGTHETEYRYQGTGLMSSRNWGFLGFHAQKIHDLESGIITYRQFRQDFPHFGATARLLQCHGDCASGELLTSQRFHYDSVELAAGGNILQTPYVSQFLEAQLEGGQLLGYQERTTTLETETPDTGLGALVKRRTTTKRIVTSAVVDDSDPTFWGEVKTAQINSADVQRTSQTITDFLNRTSSWLIGFTELETVRQYRGDIDGELDLEKSVIAVPWPGTNRPGSIEQYPGDTQYALKVDYTYDGSGNLKTEVVSGADVETRTTQVLEFLDNRYPTLIENPLEQQVTVGYDERFGRVDQITDANFRTTGITYDPFGREEVRNNPDSVEFTSTYEACSACEAVNGVNPRYKLTTNSSITPGVTRYYDTLGRLLREETEGFDGSTSRRDFAYNTQGRLDYHTEPYLSTESMPPFTAVEEFDNRGRVRKLKKPDDARVTTSYSVEGGRVKVRVEEQVLDADGNLAETQVKERYYLVTGDLDKTIDAAGSTDQVTTSYTYYGSGLLDTVTVNGDSGDFVSSFKYDLAGYRTQMTDPNLGIVKSAYNALGQLDNQTDNKDQKIEYSYDLLGRLLTQTDADGIAEWTYDPANGVGALGSRSYSQGGVPIFSESYTYNAKAQLETVNTSLKAGGLSRTYQHGYSYYGAGDGRLQTISYPNGAAVTYDYGTDSRGYLHEIRDQNDNPIKTFNQLNARGQVEQEVYGNGLVTTRSYDPVTGRLSTINTGGGSIQNNEYEWRSNGALESRLTRTSVGVIDKEEGFTYDGLNRLLDTTVTAGGATRTLSTRYSKLGNITSKTSSHPGDTQVTGYQYGQTQNAGPNAVSNVTIDGVIHTLHYDLNGAITKYDSASGDDKWITWNARQLPTEIVLGNSKTTTTPTARDRFQYGPNGERFYRETSWWDVTAKRLRTERAFVLGDFEEQLPANDPDYRRIDKTRLDANVVHIVAYPAGGGREEFMEYLHRDHLGSVEKITDESGLVILDTAFEPFGARRSADWQGEISEQELQDLLIAQGFTTRRGFTGHEHLDRTGLIHMNGRIYDPTLGRFLSPDPIVQAPTYSQSWNRYSYVFNNPLSLVDPTGYKSCSQEGLEESLERVGGLRESNEPGEFVYVCWGASDDSSVSVESPAPDYTPVPDYSSLPVYDPLPDYVPDHNPGVGTGGGSGKKKAKNKAQEPSCDEIECVEVSAQERTVVGGDITGFDSWHYDSELNSSDALLVGVSLAPAFAPVVVEALGVRATAHGAARVGANATRAGSLTRWELFKTRILGASTVQADGASVYYRALESGRYHFAVYGENGLITSGNWSAKSVVRMAERYGWKNFP